MPYSSRIKSFAYATDPECWISYSGKPVEHKRRMETRRIAALNGAERYIAMMDMLAVTTQMETTMAPAPSIAFIVVDDRPVTATRVPRPRRNPPMKVNMLLHFYAVCEAFAPEKCRTSPAYTQFVKELLKDGLIERPTKEEREAYPGWAYQTTAKGDALVNAICAVPNPVERVRYVIPS